MLDADCRTLTALLCEQPVAGFIWNDSKKSARGTLERKLYRTISSFAVDIDLVEKLLGENGVTKKVADLMVEFAAAMAK